MSQITVKNISQSSGEMVAVKQAKKTASVKAPSVKNSVAGKNRVSHRARKHGLFDNKHLLIEGESQRDYQKLRRQFIKEYDPISFAELTLVERMVEASWKLKRTNNMMSKLLSEGVDNFSSFQQENYLAGTDKMNKFALYNRYEVGLNKEYYRAMHELERVQAKRRGEKTAIPQMVDINMIQ